MCSYYRVKRLIMSLLTGLLPTLISNGDPLILHSNKTSQLPGQDEPTPWLLFQIPGKTIEVAGFWDGWKEPVALGSNEVYRKLDVRSQELPFGRYEYKFITDDSWESGANRVFYINRNGDLEAPSDLITRSEISSPNEFQIFLKNPLAPKTSLEISIEPETKIASWHVTTPQERGFPEGYVIRNGTVLFVLDEQTYGLHLTAKDVVTIAGNFSGW